MLVQIANIHIVYTNTYDVVDHILSEDIAFIECSNKLCVKDDVVEEEALVCA